MKRAKWQEKAARQAIRARERAELARLRLELRAAKERRARLVREARAMCKRGRLTLKARLRAEREALRRKAESARRAERQACRARKALAKRAGARSVAVVKSAISAERHARATQRLQAGEVKRRTAAEALQEADDAVLRDIPQELVPLWNRVRNRFKASSRKSRAEAFMQWAEENPGEVVVMQQADADREIEKLIASERALAKKSRLRKTRAEIEAELAAVPF